MSNTNPLPKAGPVPLNLAALECGSFTFLASIDPHEDSASDDEQAEPTAICFDTRTKRPAAADVWDIQNERPSRQHMRSVCIGCPAPSFLIAQTKMRTGSAFQDRAAGVSWRSRF